jgi:predicted RNA-binding protein with PUA-like domain
MASEGKSGYWLFKQEPGCYSYSDLERDRRTVWDGVSNKLAQRYLRQVRVGDRVLFYHTGDERAVVGEMVVVAGPQPASTTAGEVVVEVEAVRRLSPVTLARIKADPTLRDWELVRLPRLSIVPVTAWQWQRVEQLSQDGMSSVTA